MGRAALSSTGSVHFRHYSNSVWLHLQQLPSALTAAQLHDTALHGLRIYLKHPVRHFPACCCIAPSHKGPQHATMIRSPVNQPWTSNALNCLPHLPRTTPASMSVDTSCLMSTGGKCIIRCFDQCGRLRACFRHALIVSPVGSCTLRSIL